MTSYILPNRVGYIDYIQNKFHPDKISESKKGFSGYKQCIV